jgi:predicted amidophosphoribosyltransferase
MERWRSYIFRWLACVPVVDGRLLERTFIVTTSLSERAAAKGPKPVRVACPNCEATFDLNKIGKPRSINQHRRFWAVMHALWHHWPETEAEQFSTMNDLRLHVTMACGWRKEAARIPISGMKLEHAKLLAEAAIKAAGANAAIRIHKDNVVIFVPVSIRFDRLAHLKFCALNADVDAFVASKLGITADELLNQMEKAA